LARRLLAACSPSFSLPLGCEAKTQPFFDSDII
jgi:hypothetical protein